jgi:ribosomal protein S3AE
VEDNRTLNFSKMKVSENLNHSITKKLHDFIKSESSKDDEISISTPVINEDEIGDTIVKLEKKIMELQTVFQVIGMEY